MGTARIENKAEITNEQIAARAYERFVARGREHGHDVEDWLAAEADLKRGRAKARETFYDVVLLDPGSGVIEVVRLIREMTGMALPEVKSLIDARPRAIKRALELKDAESMRRVLEKHGARIELKPAKSSVEG
jgi:ribosomal protein L7/L12